MAMGKLIEFPGRPGSAERHFWILQLGVWPIYALILMIPWIGVYTVLEMIPNKVAVAVSGIAITTVLRNVLDRSDGLRKRYGVASMIGTLAVSIVAAASLWNVSLAMMFGRSVDLDVHRAGGLFSGVPQLSGALYHMLVLMTWSLCWLVVRTSQRGETQPQPGVERIPASNRIVFKDGATSIVLDPDDIDWIGSEGDYIRVHAGKRNLLLRKTLSSTEAMLSGHGFVRIHRSLIARTGMISELRPRPNNELDVILRDGTKLRSSRSYSDKLRSAIAPASSDTSVARF